MSSDSAKKSQFPSDHFFNPVPPGPVPRSPKELPVQQVELTIDGQKISVPETYSILEAAQSIGIKTPTLCYLETLTPVNVCRVCVVELEGSRVLVPACSRKIESGMVVRTDSERVQLNRRLVLELLASSVDISTAPEFLEYIELYQARPQRFGSPATPENHDNARPGHHALPHETGASTVAQPVKNDNNLYVRDYGKCILCYKCVEACGEDAQNTFAIAVAGRGFDTRISTEYNVPLPDSACVYCGNCIGVCPTGALMFQTEHQMRAEGTWDENQQSSTDTICPYCGVGCTLTLQVQKNKIVKVTSPLDDTVTNGNLCIKGRFGWQFVQEEDDPEKT